MGTTIGDYIGTTIGSTPPSLLRSRQPLDFRFLFYQGRLVKGWPRAVTGDRRVEGLGFRVGLGFRN